MKNLKNYYLQTSFGDTLTTTINRKVYNQKRKIKLEDYGEINCSLCRYHKRDNESSKWYGTIIRRGNCKTFRYPNWKLIKKIKKQYYINFQKYKILEDYCVRFGTTFQFTF